MKTIGQFAKEHGVTVKTLHHYEKMELIIPKEVDPDTGYRYYSDAESTDLKIILFLKDLGLSLSEIKQVMNDDFNEDLLKELISYKQSQSKHDRDAASIRLHKLSTILEILDTHQSEPINYKELIQMSEKELDTGKYGRGDFVEQSEKLFEQALQNNTSLCVVQMDLDKFKQVNDTYGHDIGDIVLSRTQDEIVSTLQEYDYKSLLERKGGDEFSITVVAGPLKTAKMVSDILNRVVGVDYSDVAEDLKVSITAGIAAISKRDTSYGGLVHRATTKLYDSKRTRK